MKKSYLVILISSLALNACLPAFLQPAGSPTPDRDIQATIAAGLTVAAQSLEPEPSPSLVPSPTRTATVTASVTNTVVSSTPSTPSETPFATLTTGTASTPTNVTGTPGTPVPGAVASASPTETLHPRFYGTQPPAIAFGRLKLINRSKAEAYISIKCVTSDGQVSIIEYPVPRRLDVHAPAGKCTYVAWVGGRKMSGQFSLSKSGEKTITLYKDRVGIK